MPPTRRMQFCYGWRVEARGYTKLHTAKSIS
jgi:hypothetical protein